MLRLRMIPLYVLVGAFFIIPTTMIIEAKLAAAVERSTQTVLDAGRVVINLR